MTCLIVYGLPGSGKTELLKLKRPYCVIDLDRWQKIYCNEDIKQKIIQNKLKEFLKTSNSYLTIAIDGLITTNLALKQIIDLIPSDYEIIVHYFNEDRQNCIINDACRLRGQQSNITIKNLKYETPNFSQFPGVKFVEEKVYIKQDWEMFYYEKNIKFPYLTYYDSVEYKNIILSEEWSTGGTTCDCNDNCYDICSDEPLDIVECFGYILDKIRPNLNYKAKEKILLEVSETFGRSVSDYYGGSESFECYSLHMKKLYDYIIKNKLLNKNIKE